MRARLISVSLVLSISILAWAADGSEMGPPFLLGNLGRGESAPAPWNSCASAPEILCGSVTYGNTAGGTDAISSYPCCAKAMTGPEYYYFFHNPSVQDVAFTLTPTGNQRLDLFLLSGCDGASCLYHGDESIQVPNLPAGYYTIAVDGEGGDAGAFSLAVTCLPHTIPILSACFETGPDGFTASGFWHRVTDPTQILCSADMRRFVTYPDYAALPSQASGRSA